MVPDPLTFDLQLLILLYQNLPCPVQIYSLVWLCSIRESFLSCLQPYCNTSSAEPDKTLKMQKWPVMDKPLFSITKIIDSLRIKFLLTLSELKFSASCLFSLVRVFTSFSKFLTFSAASTPSLAATPNAASSADNFDISAALSLIS